MIRARITRRGLIGAIGTAASWLVAACSSPEEPQAAAPLRRDPAAGDTVPVATVTAALPAPPVRPTRSAGTGIGVTADDGRASRTITATPSAPNLPLTVAVDPAMPRSLAQRAESMRAQVTAAIDGRGSDGGAGADVTIALLTDGQSGSNDGPVVFIEHVAVVSRRLLVRAVTLQQLADVWSGVIGDWAELGSPTSYGVVHVNYKGAAGPLDANIANLNVETLDDLAMLLDRERGAVAIIPFAEVDFRFRTLDVGGVNPMRPGDAVNPLRLGLNVRARNGLSASDIKRIQQALAVDNSPTPTSMTWTGDIIFGRKVHVKMVEYGDWAAPFRSIWPELVWADTTIGDLECSLSDSFETPTDQSTFSFKTSTAAVAGLELAQMDILSRANNHAFDFGPIGMDDTTAVLNQAGILHFGIGANLDQARQPAVFERNGVTYALLGYNGILDEWNGATSESAGVCPLIDWIVAEDIRREVANGHVVIPYFHWGVEYVSDPNEEQRAFARLAIDEGAAMVIGSHPHWVQAVETYKGKPIVYSLGNFIFDQNWSLETQQGMIAHVWMRGATALRIDLVPVFIEDRHKPRLMPNWEAAPVLERVWAASDALIAGG